MLGPFVAAVELFGVKNWSLAGVVGEHGEELVKDIEKVYGMNHVSPRAKEFLKHGISMLRGKH